MPKKGYKMTEGAKMKMSEAHKGKKPSKETREKLREALKGRKRPEFSQEWRDNLSNSHKGKKFSMDTREKMSEALKGNKNGKGYKHTREAREKISEANKGKKISEGHRKILSEVQKGYGNSNWKGGTTPKDKKIRHSIEYRLWREAVFARDSWTCQKTGVKGGELRCHHIQNFSDYPELRFAIDNGITLSKEAHQEFHNIYGKKKNTKKQLEQYLN